MEKYTDYQLLKASGLTDPKTSKQEIFKAVAAKCVDGKIINPETGRCVKSDSSLGRKVLERLSAHCPKGKILNLASGRCVSKTGAIGRKLLKAKKSSTKEKVCSEGKILNTETGRCVSETGAIGRRLLQAKSPSKKKTNDKTTKKTKESMEDISFTEKGFTIFTKEGCGYCVKAKNLIKNYYPIQKEILVRDDNKKKVYEYLDEYTNSYRYFPMIFYEGEFVGGYVDILEYFQNIPKELIVPMAKDAKKTQFEGNRSMELSSLVYLRTKHPKDCIVIPTIKFSESMKKAQEYTQDWSSINVMADDSEVTMPEGLSSELNKCLANDSIRFIIISLGLFCGGYSHAGMLIYDKTDKELERFEPHGASVKKSVCYGSDKIDVLLKEKMKKLIPDMKKYYEPQSFCPYLGPQKVESRIEGTPGADPSGYCSAWSIWYADVRLSNPDKRRDEALAFAKSVTKKNPNGIKKYIRSYSQFLAEFNRRLQRSKKPDVMLVKYIKEGFKK